MEATLASYCILELPVGASKIPPSMLGYQTYGFVQDYPSVITVLHLQARDPKAQGLGDLPKEVTGWQSSSHSGIGGQDLPLIVCSWGLYCPPPSPLKSGGTWPVEPGFRAPPLSQQVSHSRQWLISE